MSEYGPFQIFPCHELVCSDHCPCQKIKYACPILVLESGLAECSHQKKISICSVRNWSSENFLSSSSYRNFFPCFIFILENWFEINLYIMDYGSNHAFTTRLLCSKCVGYTTSFQKKKKFPQDQLIFWFCCFVVQMSFGSWSKFRNSFVS